MINQTIINDLISKKDSIIPVIGEDAIEYYYQGKAYNFQQFIITKFTKDYPKLKTPDIMRFTQDYKEKDDKDKKYGYYWQSVLRQHFNANYDGDLFLDQYERFVKDAIGRGELKLKPLVKNFLLTYSFPLIITTLCFKIIEKDLSCKTKGDDNCSVLNYQTVWYEGKKDVKVFENCVFHIFGEAADGKEWVCDEDKLLEFLHLLNNEGSAPEELTCYISEQQKRLFVLGCHLPNWLFRFLWYPIHHESRNKKSKQGYWINQDKVADDFESFLNDIKYLSDNDVDELLENAVTKRKEERKQYLTNIQSKVEQEELYDIFISYASEDRPIVEDIDGILRSKGLNPWFDERGESEIKMGDRYWNNIQRGIELSAHYMPIITSNFVRKMQESSNLKKEFEMVRKWYKENNTKLPPNYSIPVIVVGEEFNGFQLDSSYVEQVGRLSWDVELFDGRKMAEFDKSDIQKFVIKDWLHLKSNQ